MRTQSAVGAARGARQSHSAARESRIIVPFASHKSFTHCTRRSVPGRWVHPTLCVRYDGYKLANSVGSGAAGCMHESHTRRWRVDGGHGHCRAGRGQGPVMWLYSPGGFEGLRGTRNLERPCGNRNRGWLRMAFGGCLRCENPSHMNGRTVGTLYHCD